MSCQSARLNDRRVGYCWKVWNMRRCIITFLVAKSALCWMSVILFGFCSLRRRLNHLGSLKTCMQYGLTTRWQSFSLTIHWILKLDYLQQVQQTKIQFWLPLVAGYIIMSAASVCWLSAFSHPAHHHRHPPFQSLLLLKVSEINTAVVYCCNSLFIICSFVLNILKRKTMFDQIHFFQTSCIMHLSSIGEQDCMCILNPATFITKNYTNMHFVLHVCCCTAGSFLWEFAATSVDPTSL